MRKKFPIIDARINAAFFEQTLPNEEHFEKVKNLMGHYKTWVHDVEDLRTQLDVAGIDKAFLLPLDLTTTKNMILGTNEQINQMADEHSDILYGFCSIDPKRDDALEALEEAFNLPNIMGLNLHPHMQEFFADDEMMDPIYDLCMKKNKPIMFTAGMCAAPNTDDRYGQPLRYERVARDFPSLRICLAHMGWPWVSELCMLMLKHRNVYADLSLLYFDNPAETYDRLFGIDMGPYWHERSFRHQLMFASDEPSMEMIRMKKALDKIELRKETREMIMGLNALRFMGLEELSDDDIV